MSIKRTLRSSSSSPLRRAATPQPASVGLAVPPTVTRRKEGAVSFVDSGALASRKRVVIGIDPSLTGPAIAVLATDGTYLLVRLHTRTKVDKVGVGKVERLLELQRFFTDHLRSAWLQSEQVLHIVMEGYGFATQKAHGLGELGGILRLDLLKQFGSPLGYPTLIAANSLKKFVTGKGSGDKNVMLLAMFKKWGLDVDDDNMADSYGLARVALAISTGTTDYGYETEVVERLRPHTECPTPSP